MSGSEAILFANEAFYQAFLDRDIDAMDALWAQTIEPTCLHPGWQPLFGREAVMKSWFGILANPGSPTIKCRNATAKRVGSLGYVICFEEIDGQYLLATNIFVEEEGDRGKAWRLLHHQSGPTSAQPEPETADKPALN